MHHGNWPGELTYSLLIFEDPIAGDPGVAHRITIVARKLVSEGVSLESFVTEPVPPFVHEDAHLRVMQRAEGYGVFGELHRDAVGNAVHVPDGPPRLPATY